MGRKRSWPPKVYHCTSGVDRIRVYEGDRPRLIDLGPTGSPAAAREYARILAELAAHGGSLPRKKAALTVDELIDAHDAWAKAYHVAKQYQRVRRALQGVLDLYGGRPAADFGPVALEAVQAHFAALRDPDSTRLKNGLCRNYVNALMGCIVQAWKWAARKELIGWADYERLTAVPWLRKGKSPARESAPVVEADPAAVEAVLPLLLPPVAAMVRLQQRTGARAGEMVIARPADIDRDGIEVDGVRVWVYTPATHKTDHLGRLRQICFGPRCQAVLEPFLGRPEESYCFSPKDAYAAAGLTNSLRRERNLRDRYDGQTYARALRRACLRAGVEPWHSHQLRHYALTVATLDYDEETAQLLADHSGKMMTRRYNHAGLRKKAAVAARDG